MLMDKRFASGGQDAADLLRLRAAVASVPDAPGDDEEMVGMCCLDSESSGSFCFAFCFAV
jgi:hypothetical protein